MDEDDREAAHRRIEEHFGEPRDIELVIAILEGAVLSSETGKAVAVADMLQAGRTGIA